MSNFEDMNMKEYLKSGDFVSSPHGGVGVIFIAERKIDVIKIYYTDNCNPYFYNIDDFFDSMFGEYKILTTAEAYKLIEVEENRLKHKVVNSIEQMQGDKRVLALSTELVKKYESDYKSFSVNMSKWKNNLTFRR